MQCWFQMFADKIGKNTSVSYYRWEYGFYIWSLQMFFAFSSAKYLHFPILSASGGLWEIMLDVQPGWSSLCICWAVALWLSLLHICIGVSISPPVTHELILQWEILVFCSCSSWHELQVSIRTWAILFSWYLNTSFLQQWQPVLVAHLPLHNGGDSWIFPVRSWSDLAGD